MGHKSPILCSRKTTKGEGGGQNFPILRQYSLWTAPKGKDGLLALSGHSEFFRNYPF